MHELLNVPYIQTQLHTLHYEFSTNGVVAIPPEVAHLSRLTNLTIRLNIDSASTTFALNNPELTALCLKFGASAPVHYETITGTAPLERLTLTSTWMRNEPAPFLAAPLFSGIRVLTFSQTNTSLHRRTWRGCFRALAFLETLVLTNCMYSSDILTAMRYEWKNKRHLKNVNLEAVFATY